MAPSTFGMFLRAFTFGHIRQLDRVLAEALRRAWALGAGRGRAARHRSRLHHLRGVRQGQTRCRLRLYEEARLPPHPGHPGSTGEVLHVRMRKGAANTDRGAVRFVEELVARVRRARATGELFMRFDSGFWSNATIATLKRLGVGYTMGVRMVKSVVQAVEAIEESAWTPIDYTADGEAEVAECDYQGQRLIVRRTRLVGHQAALWPRWRHFAFVTDLEGDAVEVDAFHRAHATVELAVRDLKEGAGLEHVPPGQFFANAAWLVCAALAHDLIRWTAMLGDIRPRTSSPWPAPCGLASCPYPAGSSVGPGAQRCEPRSSGRGRRLRTAPSTFCEASSSSGVAPHSRSWRTADDFMTALTTEAEFTNPWSSASCLQLMGHPAGAPLVALSIGALDAAGHVADRWNQA